MTTPILKLTKVLELEQSQDFGDRAVIGGLETFVHRWRLEALGNVEPDVIERVSSALDGYSGLDEAGRQERVASALRAAQRDMDAARPQPAPPVTASPTRTSGPSRPPRAGAPRGRRTTAAPGGAAGPARATDHPDLDLPLESLKGLGEKTIEPLHRLGIATVRDLLLHAPARYQDYRAQPLLKDLEPDTDVTIAGTVTSAGTKPIGNGRTLLSVGLSDTTGRVTLRFFNQPYLERQFGRGRQVIASGRVQQWAGRFYFDNPDWEPYSAEAGHAPRLQPIYPLTAGITQRWLRNRIRRSLDRYGDHFGEPIALATLDAEGLPTRPAAIRDLHAPASPDDAAGARRRLAIDELVAVQLWSRRRRHLGQSAAAPDLSSGRDEMEELKRGLPFALTGAQERALDAVAQDLSRPIPMSRLIQGDVGSGKTAVAAGAVAMAVAAGYQAAVMAPTEILADQHLASFQSLLAHMGYAVYGSNIPLPDEPAAEPAAEPARTARHTIALLTGSLASARKEQIRRAVNAGEIDVLIGTHAVIQDSVSFARLGLSVVDEQHRFGVMQRATLAIRGDAEVCHQLVMTATPIPRTLALALNADMDHTIIDEVPPGRRPVETRWVSQTERERAYQFIRHRISLGEQAFVVCPLVQASEIVDAPAAEDEYARLSEVFSDLRLGLLHGRMTATEKERTMTRFRERDIDILVATTVIEVGVDVPNATMLLVEGADRFGLAQLHQLRGRVGRGDAGGTCMLVADDASEAASRRLDAMVRTTDGMALAELDLELRGAGDYFGLRQSGAADSFQFARDATLDVVAQSGRIALAISESDPLLEAPEHEALARSAAAFDAAVQRT